MFLSGNQSCSLDEQKQNSVSLLIAEAEHIAIGNFCSQLLWMKKLLGDYGLSQETMVVYFDNLWLLISLRIRYNILRLNA